MDFNIDIEFSVADRSTLIGGQEASVEYLEYVRYLKGYILEENDV